MSSSSQPPRKRRQISPKQPKPMANAIITQYPTIIRNVNISPNHWSLMNFPPGYRFCPHDYELIIHYLKKKINNEPLPRNKIVDVNLYAHTPDDITGRYPVLGEKEWYFFTPRDRKYPNGNRPNRAAGDGYWKATGADKDVKHRDDVVGHKKTLVFYQGKPPRGEKTNWIMHEFRIDGPARVREGKDDMKLDDWILCRIYHKDAKKEVKGEIQDQPKPVADSTTLYNQTSSCVDHDDLGENISQLTNDILLDYGTLNEHHLQQMDNYDSQPVGYGTYDHVHNIDNRYLQEDDVPVRGIKPLAYLPMVANLNNKYLQEDTTTASEFKEDLEINPDDFFATIPNLMDIPELDDDGNESAPNNPSLPPKS